MRNKILIAILFLVFLFVLGIIFNRVFSFGPSEAKNIDIQAPDFTLEDLHYNNITLSSLRGKSSAILFFWATWCPHCVHKIDSLNKMHPELLNKNIKFFAIDIGERKEKIERFAQDYMINYPILLDKDKKVADMYGIVGIPTFVGIDKQGMIRFKENYLPKHFSSELTE